MARIAHTGGWGKALKKKGSKKKGSKKKGSKKKGSKKKSSKKRGKKRAKRIGAPKSRRSVRKHKPRKKGSKRRATTTTFKTSGVKLKMKCPPGKAAVSRSAKARVGNRTYVAIGGRCVAL